VKIFQLALVSLRLSKLQDENEKEQVKERKRHKH